MAATDDSAPIPITDSQILPIHAPWRSRLAPYRRHLFVAAILLGSGLGAALFFATHDPAVEGTGEPSAAATAPLATPVTTPPQPAPAATGEERTTVKTTRTESTVKTGNTVRTVKQVTTVRSTKKRTSSSTTRRSTTRPR